MRANMRKKKGDIHKVREGEDVGVWLGAAPTGECGEILFPPKKTDGEK